ncbi:MAG: G5 domain-containing protein [Candidatus Woykebacteria bacterium]
MLNKLKSQFSALSLAGKAAFIGAALVSGTVFAAAVSPSSEPKPAPKVESTIQESKPTNEVKTITETENVSFETEEAIDTTLEKGKTRITQEGRDGTKEIKYEVTYEGGVEVSRKKISEKIVTEPVKKIVANGTYVAPLAQKSNCDPNYSGCVPIASDVDCAGGSGNGPAYVSGPVQVIGYDIYDLDRDGDGTACE